MRSEFLKELEKVMDKDAFIYALNDSKFTDGYTFTSYLIIQATGILPAILPPPDVLHYYTGKKHGCLITEISKKGLTLSEGWDKEADKAAKVFIDRLKQYTKIYK